MLHIIYNKYILNIKTQGQYSQPPQMISYLSPLKGIRVSRKKLLTLNLKQIKYKINSGNLVVRGSQKVLKDECEHIKKIVESP